MIEGTNEVKAAKFIIKPWKERIEAKKPQNIFLGESSGEISAQTTTMYSIVGDTQFKEKFYSTRHQHSESKTSQMTLNEQKMQSFDSFALSIEKGLISSKLSRVRQREMTRDRRNLMKAHQNRERDQKIQRFLNKTIKRNESMKQQSNMTFNTVKPVYARPNPEKESLIKDDMPGYWKNSLRDNQKRLKGHLSGHHFSKQVGEEMLQTFQGRLRLQKSIPRVKPEFLTPVCSRKSRQQRITFNINGSKVIRNLQTLSTQKSHQTMHSICQSNSQPNVNFNEIYKLSYDPQHTWLASDMPFC